MESLLLVWHEQINQRKCLCQCRVPPLVGIPVCVEGGRQACADAGIQLAGGHSIDAPEPIFGLAVTGNQLLELASSRFETIRQVPPAGGPDDRRLPTSRSRSGTCLACQLRQSRKRHCWPPVIPAQAGIQYRVPLAILDSRLRGNDGSVCWHAKHVHGPKLRSIAA